MSKSKEIIEGWKNVIIKKEHVERIAGARRNICNTCEFHSKFHETNRADDHCTACGCPLMSKTRSLSSSCPKGKWGSVRIENE